MANRDAGGAVVETARWLGPGLGLVLVQQLLFPVPAGALVNGVILGIITALVAVGMYLIYRANRVLNFAQAQLGVLPAVIVTLLIVESGWPWWPAMILGIVGSIALGVVCEFLIIRRFFKAPRLIVTVATLGLGQLLTFLGLLAPRWWDTRVQGQRIDAPLDVDFTIGTTVFDGNDVFVLVVGPLALVATGALLRYSSVGVAIRAAAARPERANMLGIPVKGLQSVVWGLATLLAFLAMIMRTGIAGLPTGGDTGLLLLLRALAALMLGRMVDLRAILVASIGIGIVQQGVFWNSSSSEAPAQMAAILAVAIIASLVFRRADSFRTDDDNTGGWQAVGDVRPLSAALMALPIQKLMRVAGWALVVTGAVVLPHLVGPNDSLRLSALLIMAIVLTSLVVLTGWAGQISLGQAGLFAAGAAIGGWLNLTFNADLIVACLGAGVAGAAIAAVAGLPALRLRGMYLAVVTLALALAGTAWLLNPDFFDWVPDERIPRLPLLGRFDYDTPTRFYYVTLVVTVLAVVALQGIRHSRTGRVLVALRENEAGAAAFGVSVVRAKLSAFAISGFFAALAGGLFVHHQQAYDVGFYGGGSGIGFFIAAVIGGLGSIFGAFLGSLWFFGTFWWLEGRWRLFASGIGGLIVLLIAPDGVAGLVYRLRQMFLTNVWERRHRGDGQVIEEPDTDHALSDAEHHLEELDDSMEPAS
ncbi:MAG: ABC transporter permease [Acidimicrobiia bacterium]|nr:ABC transporter permease [Acidimicrobiia bacterium]